MIKRIVDLIASLLGLILLSPVLIIISVWVKFDSAGPVIFKQVRVGRNGKEFNLLKFRSMRVHAERAGLLTVGARDSRITPSGYYLRKYKLDELVQLVNVLTGDMSIVGPRPEVRKYVDLYSASELRVLSVRPGITDKASIQFSNENELLAKADDPEQYYIKYIMPRKLELNLWYIEHQNIWVDLHLVLLTLRKIFA